MPAGRTNKFARARQHLRSTHLDEKIQMLSEIPTNNTGTFFVVEPDVFETIPAVRAPLDLTADDASLVGKDTSGLFDNAGNSLAESPPGDTSYILGPMVSVYFPDGEYSAIGYIQKDTRKVINLARIPGKVSEWGVGGNVEGFTSYSQLTVEQALWYRDRLINGNTSSYRVFYIGVFEQLNSETDVTDPSTGVDIDEFGRWLGEIISDGFISEPERQELIKKGIKGSDPNMPPGIANPLLSALRANLGDILSNVVGGAIPLARAINQLIKLKKNAPAVDYSVDIALSVLQNKPIKYDQKDIDPNQINALVNNLNPDDIGNSIPINSEPVPYADDNIITDKNGNVRPRNQFPVKPDGSMYSTDELKNNPDLLDQANAWSDDYRNHPNNTSSMSDNDAGLGGHKNPLHAAGQAQGQIVVPKDGSEPYFKYEDHAYHNLESTDPGEVPDPVKTGLSNLVHQAAGHGAGEVEPGTKGQNNTGEIDTTTPNTGGMSGYPSNIRGDVIKGFEVPLSELPPAVQSAVQSKLGESTCNLIRQKKILREIKKPYVVPEIVQEKVKYRPKINKTGIKSVGDGLMKKAEVPTSFKRLEDTMWKKQDRDWNARHSQERKNMILDTVGTSDHAWEYITDRSASDNDAKMYEHFGQGVKNKIIEKKKIGNDYIIKMYNEEGKVETVTQSVLNERLQKQHELVEQETIRAPKDPLIARIRNKLYSQIDYPDKPAKLGYPDEPPKQMVGGYHPEFGDRHAYYNRLDRHSADTMQNAPTQNLKIDKKVESQTTEKKLKRVKNLRKNK